MIMPRSAYSTLLHAPTGVYTTFGFYVLFTGFTASTNVANITVTCAVEFIPNSTYSGICNVEYAELGCATDEVANDLISKYEVLAIATVPTI